MPKKKMTIRQILIEAGVDVKELERGLAKVGRKLKAHEKEFKKKGEHHANNF